MKIELRLDVADKYLAMKIKRNIDGPMSNSFPGNNELGEKM